MRVTAWSFLLLSPVIHAGDWSGYVSLEPRVFLDAPAFAEQTDQGLSPSAVLAPEWRIGSEQGDDQFTFSPYFRFDADDRERSHIDLREALWQRTRGAWSWQIGVGRVFWGVTESRHLVDVINQVDQVEDIDEEDRLGQPMIALERWTPNAGTFAVFMLPGFRERPFPADDARLRGPWPIDTDSAEYESGAKDRRIDWALRWSHAVGAWDIGLSAFSGTSREPTLLPRVSTDGDIVLVPRYEVIDQLGLDLQYTQGAWLWKLESIARRGQGDPFGAVVAGFEYTFYNLGGHGVDLGLLAEYLYDGRDENAPPTFYDDDWFAGARLGFNDADDTAVLAGALVDDDGTFAVVEAERRLGEAWKIELEARLFINVTAQDPLLSGVRDDSFVTLRLARYL